MVEAFGVMDLGAPATVIGEEHDPQRSVSRLPVPATEVDEPLVELDEELDHVRVAVDVHEAVGRADVGHEHVARRSEHLTLDLVHRAGGPPSAATRSWRARTPGSGAAGRRTRTTAECPCRSSRSPPPTVAFAVRVEVTELVAEGRRHAERQEQRRERDVRHRRERCDHCRGRRPIGERPLPAGLLRRHGRAPHRGRSGASSAPVR